MLHPLKCNRIQSLFNLVTIVCSVFLIQFTQLYADFSAADNYSQYPELHWLASEAVQITQENRAKPTQDAYSIQVAGALYPELDRTLLSLKCLEWFWNGTKTDYEAFIQDQPQPQLTWESFSAIHEHLMHLSQDLPNFTEEQLHEALKVSIVIGDLGKSIPFKQKMEKFGIHAEDHDVFLEEVMHQSEALKDLPSFQKLPLQSQQLIQDASGVGHFGHMSHLEGGPKIFSELKEFLKKEHAVAQLKFEYLSYLMDTASAAGHVTQKSSLVFNENVYQVHSVLWNSILLLPTHSEEEVYADYLKKRGEWVGVKDINTPFNFLVARAACLMRLYTPEQGSALSAALKGLPESQLANIRSYFYIDLPKYSQSLLAKEATPTYMPAVLVNLINNPSLGNTQLERIQKAVALGLTSLATVLLDWRGSPDYNPDLVICFNPIAKVAKETPEKLTSDHFAIDIHSGFVTIKE